MSVQQADGDCIMEDDIIEFLSRNESICFRQQQLNESDLSADEKKTIAIRVWNRSRVTFVQRFGAYLLSDHLDFIERDADADVRMAVKDVRARGTPALVKNRRFEAMRKLIAGKEYFSEIEMMKRNPTLYEQMVGCYMTADEKKARDRIALDSASTLSSILMEGMQRSCAQQKCDDVSVIDDDSSDVPLATTQSTDIDEDPSTSTSAATCGAVRWGDYSDEPIATKSRKPTLERVSEEERLQLRHEFTAAMHRSFLEGQDIDFDYTQVDEDESLDNRQIEDQDAEERYFDEEEPATVVAAYGQQPEPEPESEDELDIYMSGLNQQSTEAKNLARDMSGL